jgi:hypothetical protein
MESSPCQVVAMDKRMLQNVRLNPSTPVQGLSVAVPVYVSPSASPMQVAGSGAMETLNASWGAVKAEYR